MIICEVGAYGMVLSSKYNLRPASPEILVKGLKTIVIKKRQKIIQIKIDSFYMVFCDK